MPRRARLILPNVTVHLIQRYVQYINRTYHSSGTLWEGRYKSCLLKNVVCPECH